MPISEPIILYQAPKKEGEDTHPLISSYDNENLIYLFHMLGFHPQRVVAEDGRLSVFFLDSDCNPIKSKVYSANPIPHEDIYSAMTKTRAWWKDMISLSKQAIRNANRP